MHVFMYVTHRLTRIVNSLPDANTATRTTAMTNTSRIALCMTQRNYWTLVTDQEPCAMWRTDPAFIHRQVMEWLHD